MKLFVVFVAAVVVAVVVVAGETVFINRVSSTRIKKYILNTKESCYGCSWGLHCSCRR